MATRCINALNELDEISEKIFYKYSKTRLKADVEGRIRESKSRAEWNVSSQQEKCTSRRNSYYSSISSTAVSKNASRYSRVKVAKSMSSTKTLNPPNSSKRAKTFTDCHKKVNQISCSTNTLANDDDDSITRNTQTPSIFGKYTPGAPKYKPGKWFNLQDGVSQGIIDSFACDNLNEKALCYKVDLKESKSVPKLLRHRLEVRIGQNGRMWNEESGMKEEIPPKEDTSGMKVRPAPLSWDEQLNWENTRTVAPREPLQKKTQDQGLCETHPVIFHPEPKSQLSNATDISNEATAAYSMHLDRRLLTSDRRNPTCSGKCVTSVELQCSTDDVGPSKREQETLKRTKSQDSDFDKMDMSNTIQNITKIYRTSSVESARNMPLDRVLGETPRISVVDVPSELEKTTSVDESMENQDFENVKMNKRVSFKDEIDDLNLTIGIKTEEDTFKEFNLVNGSIKLSTKRPKSSRDRLQSNVAQDNVSLVQVERPRRPYSAPPCSPRLSRDDADFEKLVSPAKYLHPIRVPTSESEVLSETEENNLEKADELNIVEVEKTLHLQTGEDNPCSNSSDKIQNIRVRHTCKSAPTLRVAPKQDEAIPRSQSIINIQKTTNKTIPPKPVVVLSDSTIELPSNLPPAQALIEFRKKIRENLAKETADLQLDIQQLYLKHHSLNQ